MQKYYSKNDIWTLFLVSAFPLHVWTLILFFWDFSWITERSGVWNALGVGAYVLVIALFESVFVFLVILIVAFLIALVLILLKQEYWSSKAWVSAFIVLALITPGWAMLGQLYFIRGGTSPTWLIALLSAFPRPLILLYLMVGVAVLVSLLLPVWYALNSEKFRKGLDALVERISLLMILYLVLDVISLFIVAYRNNFWLS